MGCGTSKIERPQEDRQPKFAALSRTLEGIRRFRFGGTLSKKELLKVGDDDLQINDRKSVSSESEVPLNKATTESPSPKVAPETTEEMEHDNNNDDKAEDEHKAVTEAIEKLASEETDNDDKQEIDDQDGSLTCPGSPSFRVYYVESLQVEEEVYAQDQDSDDQSHCCEDDHEMNNGSSTDIDVASRQSFEEADAKTKKRGRIVKLKGVIPKVTPVKKFLSVKSCYYPSCGGRHEMPRMVSAKPVAT